MYPATKSGPSESGPLVLLALMTVFVRRAPMEDNTASESIYTVPASMVVKFYNYTNMMRTANGTLVHAA